MKRPSRDKHAIPEGEAEANLADYPLVKTERRDRGRPVGPARFRMSDEHRIKIQNSKVLSRLLSHVEGQAKLEQSQVTAAVALLKKVLPDLQSVTIGGDPLNPVMHEHKVDLTIYSVDELKTLRGILSKKAG
jgi:hypothetical protein